MSCKPHGTHHFACDCREEYVKKLERVAEAAKKLATYCNHKPDGWDALDEALQALRGKETI